MKYESELSFLCDALKKCRLRALVLSPDESPDSILDAHLRRVFGVGGLKDIRLCDYLGKIDPVTRYRFTDEFKQNYTLLRLPGREQANLLLIGPYLSCELSQKEILELGESRGVKPIEQRYLEEYYDTLPVLPEGDRLLSLIDSFCELIWHSPSFAIAELNQPFHVPASPISDAPRSDSFEEVMAGVDLMEKRYAFENELIQAVRLGQQHKESLLATAFNDRLFEKRVADPVRNAKNYSIIMNTLLRKAAEQGGVHPVYIDRVSSRYALRIEQISSLKEVSALMREMFSSYCRLVYKHSIKKYSPVVQKTILVIDSDLSADLSLGSLAAHQGISGGYLASVFKKETGKTLCEYVREKRVKHAMYLLSTTHLQIQTVALHCGIMDVQYFSKIFKRETGKTPKEYRQGARSL